MMQRLVLTVVALTLIPIQAGHSLFYAQGRQEVSDAQKTEFIELLKTLPSKGEFYTEEAARRAGPYLPVIFSFTEKDLEIRDLYAFVAISVGISADNERRAIRAPIRLRLGSLNSGTQRLRQSYIHWRVIRVRYQRSVFRRTESGWPRVVGITRLNCGT